MPMTLPIASPFCRRITGLRLTHVLVFISLSVISFDQVQPEKIEGEDTAGWSTFTSRGGWSIRYPSDLHISSCRQCDDPTAPEVAVALSKSSGQVIVMVEP